MAFIPLLLVGSGTATAGTAGFAGIIGAGGALTAGGLLTAGSAAMTVAGTLTQASGARAAAGTEKALYRYNAALDEREAQQRRTASLSEQSIRRDEMRRRLKSNRTAIGKSGTTYGGSNLLAQLETIEVMATDIANLAYGREMEYEALKSSAGSKQVMGKAAGQAGKLGVGTAIIGGVSDLAKLGIQRELRKQQAKAGSI